MIESKEYLEYIKADKPKSKQKTNWSFNLFSLIFVLVNFYMIIEISTITTQSAVVMNYVYSKWIALSISSGLAALISK